MKGIILSVIAFIVGAAMIVGGIAFTAVVNDYYTPDFDNYEVYRVGIDGGGLTAEEARDAARITCPAYGGFMIVYSWIDYDIRLIDCYREIQAPCLEYAMSVAKKYENNADLSFTVENTGKLFTIKFTGTGYPKDGGSVDLSRTYIFDIDGAGVDKLPRLVNRADFIGY